MDSLKPAAMTAPTEDRLALIVKRLALAFALVVGLGLPAGYFRLQYASLTQHVESTAQVKATAINILVAATPDLWMYQLQRMEELLLRYPLSLASDQATVRDAMGNQLVTVGVAPAPPVMVRSTPIYDSGRAVGQVEVAHSYRQIAGGTLVAGLSGLLLGALVYTTLLVLPLRALRRAAAALNREKEALCASASRYRALAESANDAIITADGAGTIVGWNPAAARMFGYTEAEAIGHPVTLLMPLQYREPHTESMRRIQAGGQRRMTGKSVELQGLTKAGREFPLEIALSEWDVLDGKFFAGIIHDITERKQVALARARHANLAAMIAQTNQAMVRLTNREELFPTVCRIAVEQGPFRFAWIGLTGDDGRRLIPVARHGEGAGCFDQMYAAVDGRDAAGLGPARQALRSGRPVVSNDCLSDPASAPWPQEALRAGVRACAALPFSQNGAVAGVINYYAGEPGFFTAEVLAMLDEMAIDISYVLDQFAHEAARNRLEATLREGEARYRQLFDANPHPMWVFDPDTLRFLAVNDAAVAHYGWSREDFLQMTLADIRPEEEVPALVRRVAAGVDEKYRTVVGSKHRKKDGTLIDVDISSHTIDFGTRHARVVSARDITDRKAMEVKLKDSLAFRELLLQAIPLPVFYKEAAGRYTGCNAAFAKFIGKTEAEIVGKTVYDVASGRLASTYRDKDLELLADSVGMQVYESEVKHADGTSHAVIFHKARIVDGAGTPTGIIGAITDITERKRTDAALRESEERFRTLLQDVPSIAVQGYGVDGTAQYWNHTSERLYGYTAEEAIGRSLLDLIIPPQMRADVEQAVKQMAETGEPIPASEFTLMRKDGSPVPVFSSHALVRIPGRAPELFCIDIDLTSQKQAAEALRAAEEQFRGLVEQSIAGIYIIQDGVFAYTNPRFAEIVGRGSTDDLSGTDPLLWVADADRKRVDERVRRLLRGEIGRTAMDFSVRRRDGVVIQVGVNAARATRNGRPAIIGMMQDISEKARAEEEIRNYVRQLKTAFMSTVEVATTISEMRDPYTTGHERRVADIAVAIGGELGLDANRLEGLRIAGHLHDIGKITIPSEILSKPGKLSAIEFQLVQAHARAGYDVLKGVEFPWPVAQVALQHHERVDGSGYPQGLTGDAILFEARIMAVADVVEAMSSHRPYRPGLGIDSALAEIEGGRGTLYDSQAADACLRLFQENRYTLPD